MRYALDAGQIRAVEERAIAEGVATLPALMERAGEALAEAVRREVPEGAVAVVCGRGNNGGDGWVAARLLHEAGRDVGVVSVLDPGELAGAAAAAATPAVKAGVQHVPPGAEADRRIASAAVIVDAVFGFGFHGVPQEPEAGLLSAMDASAALVVSADVPSGVHAGTGAATGAVHADLTITFTALKPGLLIYPGARYAGRIEVADIGIPREWAAVPGALELPDAADLRPFFPVPRPDDHKGSRGRVGLLVGSSTYPGAAVLAAAGALRMAAGFTVAVVPEPIADILRISAPGILVRPVPASPDGALGSVEAVLHALRDADAIVAGPGLTTGGEVPAIVSRLLAEVDVPLVLDADGLNALQGMAALAARRAPLVIAPHPGEAARLLGIPGDEVQADRLAAASALCGPSGVCLLKGARTIVVGAGRRALLTAGNEGLAKAGSGDVLAGMLGALLALGVPPFEAGALGAFLHGRAAEYGTRVLTTTCFTSADITSFLPDAVREVTGE